MERCVFTKQVRRVLVLPLLVFLLSVFSGCNLVAQRTTASTAIASPQVISSPFYNKVGELPVGQSYPIVDPKTKEHAQVSVLQEYVSAAGVPCRTVQLQKVDRTQETLTLCRNAAGRWFLAPSIESRANKVN